MLHPAPQLQATEERQGGAEQPQVEAEKWGKVQTALHINKDHSFSVFFNHICLHVDHLKAAGW